VLVSGNATADVRLLLYNNWGDPDDALNISMAFSHNVTLDDSSIGALYTANTSSLEEGIYYFQYGALDGGAWTETEQGFGPVNAELGKVLSYSLMFGVLNSFFNIAVLFYILILLTWWMDRSKKKMAEMEQQRAKVKEKKGAE